MRWRVGSRISEVFWGMRRCVFLETGAGGVLRVMV